MNTPPIKKIVLWLLTIFLLYAILTSPTEAANIVGSAWDVVANGVTNIIEVQFGYDGIVFASAASGPDFALTPELVYKALAAKVVKDGQMYVQAGAGIVADSVNAMEQAECVNKAKALLHAADEAVKTAARAGRAQ